METKIPLSDVSLDDAELAAISEVLSSKWLSMGSVTQAFETAFAELLGVGHAIAVSNGTTALHLAHHALGITAGDQVICPSLTFVATSNSIIYTGAEPVLADVTSLKDFSLSPESIRQKIGNNTKAITVVHYGGYACDMPAIIKIAQDHNLYVIEDAAHAPGASLDGKMLGTWGDVGCFSFFSNKNLTTAEGGMVVTDNAELADKIRQLRSHGMTSLTWDRHKGHAHSYDVVDLGFNYRLDEIRSSMGLVQLGKLDRNNQRRREIVSRYHECLKDVEFISLPYIDHPGISSNHILPILLNEDVDRFEFRECLTSHGIQTSMHYPPIHLFEYYRKRYGYQEGLLPVTEAICKREVTLPLYPDLTNEAVEFISKMIAQSKA